jgi:GT2 family glycosyltransferase
MTRLSLSVVIPTYQRPVWIKRAVRSMGIQSRLPEEVIAVCRDTDLPTHQAIDELQRAGLRFPLRRELVSQPGFMPPVERGLATAQGDIIAVMDDDAEAEDGWAERLLGHYADSTIGAVGGRCINMSDGGPTAVPVPVPPVDRVGYVNSLGLFIGNMYCQPTFSQPISADFMAGGNMSFRREVARRIEFDMELNRNVAQGYEVDIGLQVGQMGWRLIFDPLLAIRHYAAPRETIGLRVSDNVSVQWYSYNQARVTLRRLPPFRRSISFAYQLAIGQRRAPGLLPMAIAPVARKLGFDMAFAAAALKGRIAAARGVFAPS